MNSAILAFASCATLRTVEVPDNWPAYLPIYTEAEILDARFDPDRGATLSLVTPDDPDTAMSEYARMLRGAGWKMRVRRTDAEGNRVLFADHRAQKRSLTVMFTPQDGGAKLVLLEAAFVPPEPSAKKKKNKNKRRRY